MLKNLIMLMLLSLLVISAKAQNEKIIFLHHSTGRMVFFGGSVADSIEAYNKKNDSHLSITERNFPDKPYPWANYPYDYWNIWLNNYCGNYKGEPNYPNVECLDDLCKEYNIIILKHCFPGADILEDTDKPDITSSRKSLENYKLQYRALRDKFDFFHEVDFIVWTLAPLHRNATSTANASRAKSFVDWLNNDWLTEDGKEHTNIYIFDYYSYAAETDTMAVTPKVPYCLKYEYELSHENKDLHPNELACKLIGPKFYQFIIKTTQKENKK